MSRRKRAKPSPKRHTRIKEELDFLEEQLNNNTMAIMEGPTKKRWSIHDLKVIKPLNARQHTTFQSFLSGNQICAYGSPGTGKTFIALYLAMNEILNKTTSQQQLLIVRSAVPTRDLGHMPGSLEDKIALYEEPYRDLFSELFQQQGTYDNMKKTGLVKFMTTSYIRGLTWDNAVIVLDEAQNLTWEEINSVMTRVGENSRVIVIGDIKQTDLHNKKTGISGMMKFLQIAEGMSEFSHIEFTRNDIVRSQFVKSWIIATELLEAVA